MQGGHGETLRPLRYFIGAATEDESGNESEISVEEDITLGKRLDNVIYHLREIVGVFLAWPVAVCCGYPTIHKFRKHKLSQVVKGTQTLVEIQKYRNPVLDKFFQAFSFCAEEEFYLLMLPLLCWNVDFSLARRLMIVVCMGLLVGNFMKDIFRLPRPKSPPVWRPSNAEAMDSANLQDFGFPSTHTMNAISNSFYVFIHYKLFSPMSYSSLLLVLLYATSLSFSRLYLGAHTPTDVRGGVILGFLVVMASFYSESFEEVYVATDDLTLKMFISITVFLFLNPQPRPRTPTFEQNALCCGLIWGCMEGTKLMLRQGVTSSSLVNPSTVEVQFKYTSVQYQSVVLAQVYGTIRFLMEHYPVIGIPLKTILGYVVVLIFRAMTKGGLTAFLEKVLGIQVKAKIVEVDEPVPVAVRKKDDDAGTNDDKRKQRHRKRRIILSRDTSRVGNAVVKVATYTLISFNVSYTVPMIYYYTGFNK